MSTAAGGRLLLDQPTGAWRVVQGSVDILAVSLSEGGASEPREYLLTVRAGGAFYGMAVSPGGVALAAVAPSSTRVEPISGAGLEGGIQVEMLDGWVSSLCGVVARKGRGRVDATLAPGATWSGRAGRLLGMERGVGWVRVRRGRVAFGGRGGFALPLEYDGRFTAFPLSEEAWLEVEEDAELEVVDTPTVVAAGSEADGLAALHRAFLDWLARAAIERREDERARMREVSATDERAPARRAKRRAPVVQDVDRAIDTLPSGASKLVRACAVVGRAAGIDLHGPLRTSSEREPAAIDEVELIARASGVGYRRVVLRGRWWETDSGPLLGFQRGAADKADAARPVALLPTGPGGYERLEPEDGTRLPLSEHEADGLEPLAYAFYRPLPPGELGVRDIVRFLAFGVRHDLRTIVWTGVAATVLGLAAPVATGLLLDWIIPGANRLQLFHLFLGLVAVTVGGALFGVARAFAVLRVRNRVGPALQMAVIHRLIRLPLPFFRRFTAGDLGTRANAVNDVADLLGSSTVSAIVSSIVSAGAVVLLFWYSQTLALAAMAVMIPVAGFTVWTSFRALRHQRELNRVQGRLSGLVLQLLGGISKIRVAHAEVRAFGRWAREFAHLRRLRLRVGRLQNNVEVFNDAVVVLASLVVFAAYAWMTTGDPTRALTTGEFVAFHAAFGTFMASGVSLTLTAVSLLEMIPTLERATPILETRPEADQTRPDPGDLRGRIEVSRVSFRYGEAAPLILRNLSLAAEAGRFIAIVGPSGAGKSTLLRLLLGFETPTSGTVYFDGRDLQTIDVAAVRRQVGVVLQSSRLTPGDVLTNIAGSSSATMEDAQQAARMAGMEEDLQAMPMGLHTIVNEGGSNLSGGQRQRLLIARALVRRPRIIFFDEATSALDNRTQRIVSESLEHLNATRVVIAHRLSTVRNADTIYVIQAGSVVQAGTFEELMAEAGLFADLAARQST